MEKTTVGATIFKQLGGRKFAVMTGAKNFITDSTALWFKLPGKPGYVKDGINSVETRLMASDTYTVRFWRVTGGGQLPAKSGHTLKRFGSCAI